MRAIGEDMVRDAESELEETIRLADSTVGEMQGMGGFNEIFKDEEDRENIMSAIRAGELESFIETNNFDTDGSLYLESLSRIGGSDLSEKFAKGESLIGRADVRRLANRRFKASDLNTVEGTEKVIDLMVADADSRLSNGNISSENIIDMSKEGAALDFIRSEMEGHFSDKEINDLVGTLENTEDTRERLETFNKIRSKIDNPNFLGDLATRTDNDYLSRQLTNFGGNQPMDRLDRAIGEGFVKVEIQNTDNKGKIIKPNGDPSKPNLLEYLFGD